MVQMDKTVQTEQEALQAFKEQLVQTELMVQMDKVLGARGATGAQGVTGADGADGSNGQDGADGARGATGVQGATGTQGATGNQGTNATGTQGATGSTGAQGATGTQGTTGIQGATGAQGTTGIQGVTGAQGATGVTWSFSCWKYKPNIVLSIPSDGWKATNAIRVQSNNVGIGLGGPTGPQYPLEVGGNTKVNGNIIIDNNASVGGSLTVGTDGTFTGSLTVGTDGTFTGSLSAGTNISAGGNLSIGVASYGTSYKLPSTKGAIGEVLKMPASGNQLEWGPAGSTSPWTTSGNDILNSTTGDVYIGSSSVPNLLLYYAGGQHGKLGIGLTSPNHPLHIVAPAGSGASFYAAKIEGGSGVYVEEDVIVGGQIITSDIAPATGINMVTVGTDGILTSQTIPTTSPWTTSNNDISNSNSGSVTINSELSVTGSSIFSNITGFNDNVTITGGDLSINPTPSNDNVTMVILVF
jgi:hypothetical protein